MSTYLSSLVDFFSRCCSLTRSLAAAVLTRSRSSSTTVVVHAGEHLFKIVDHSKLTDTNTCLTSQTFRVGGHDWAILYYPNGAGSTADGEFSSVFIKLVSTIDTEVKTSVSFCLHDPASPATGEKSKIGFRKKFLPSMIHIDKGWGTDMFVSKANLAASGCLHKDCLVIKCTIVIHESIDEPPSDLSKDIRNLLDRGLKADLTIRVGPVKSFKVHGCMLAARSPVFRAQLCGSMMESKQSIINIDHMDADVFEVLLYYMYNDCLPKFMDKATEEATNMAQHLLVAADLYALERLKLICESKLSRALDVNTVGFILDLAEQYHCHQLKAHCLKYIRTYGQRMQAIENTEKGSRS